jgi:hypothetical protein
MIPGFAGVSRAFVLGPMAAAMLLGAPGVFAQGCAMCGTAVGGSGDPLARGLGLSVILLLGVPNLLLASIGGWLFTKYRRAAYPADPAASTDPPSHPFSPIHGERP